MNWHIHADDDNDDDDVNDADEHDDEHDDDADEEDKALVAEQDYLQDFSIPPLCGRPLRDGTTCSHSDDEDDDVVNLNDHDDDDDDDNSLDNTYT